MYWNRQSVHGQRMWLMDYVGEAIGYNKYFCNSSWCICFGRSTPFSIIDNKIPQHNHLRCCMVCFYCIYLLEQIIKKFVKGITNGRAIANTTEFGRRINVTLSCISSDFVDLREGSLVQGRSWQR